MAVCFVLWFCCVFVLCSFIVLSCICLSLIKQIKWVINGTIIKQKLSSFIIRFFDSEEPDAGLHPDSLKWPDIRPDLHIRYIPTPYHRCYCTLLFLWGIPSVCLFIILFCRYGHECADKQSWWQVTLRDRNFMHLQPALSHLSTPHHNRFAALFPWPPRWASAGRELLDFMVQGKINRGRHTDHPAGRHSIQTNQYPPPPSHLCASKTQTIRLRVVVLYSLACTQARVLKLGSSSQLTNKSMDVIVEVLDLWSPYGIGRPYIFSCCGLFFFLLFFSSPNLSRRRLDVCHTSTHGVALVRI